MKTIAKPLYTIMAALALATAAGAQTFTVLKTFNPNTSPTGYESQGTLVQGSNGTLYGVATQGGAGASGVVFSIQTNGTGFTILKNFPLMDSVAGTNSDGANPEAGLLLSGGVLYGTTANGGISSNGTVFSISTNGTGFKVLKYFTAFATNSATNTDGANPAAALILSGNALYGTTQNGGAGGSGTIFRVSTDGTIFTNIYSFTGGADGANPAAFLLLSGSTLYGTASAGGDEGDGTVFSVSTNGNSFSRLHSFSGSGTDGSAPYAGLVLSGGMLYGTTFNGDSGNGFDVGTVFRVPVTGGSGFTNLYSFTGGVDGAEPGAELLLLGGTLYGTAGSGGTGRYYGTMFKIDTSGSNFTTVCSFNGNDGWAPEGGLLLSGGAFYGTTALGGILPTVFAFASGTVFSIPTNGSMPSDLCVFTGACGAISPQTGLALSGNTLFGTTVNGGTNNTGALFEISTNGSNFADVYDFSGEDSGGDNPDGANPRSVLVLSGGMLYGTTRYGGTSGAGTVFKMNSDGTGFTNIYSFTGAYPESPISVLAVSGTTIYGAGGAGTYGSLYKLNTDGSGFTNFYTFNGTDGNGPGGLLLSGGVLYGATYHGGAGEGNLYQMNTDGSHYTNIYSFTAGSDGANPATVLVLSNNTLYGTAYFGGTNGQGTVFKINTDHSGFAVLHTFASTNSGSAVPGDLLLSAGTLYGTTVAEGSFNFGTVYSVDTSGNNFTVLKNFNGVTDGAAPNETLVLLGNTLYGTTEAGGLSSEGTVFSLTLSSSVAPIPLTITGIKNAVVLTWSNPAFSLQASTLVTGTYTNVPGASSPYTNTLSGATKFFRLQAN